MTVDVRLSTSRSTLICYRPPSACSSGAFKDPADFRVFGSEGRFLSLVGGIGGQGEQRTRFEGAAHSD